MADIGSPSLPVGITLRAIEKVRSLIVDEGNPHLNLRLYIVGGGCSGFQYGFSFEETINTDEDLVITHPTEIPGETVALVIDPLSYPYLEGATVDYLENLQGARFVVNNPNAQTTCGCGSSFSIGE